MREKLIALFVSVALTATLLARDIRTLSGHLYRNVTVTRVEATGIRITHESGVALIDFKDLPAELRKEFGYSEAAYEAGLTESKEREALAAVQRRATEAAVAAQRLADQQAAQFRVNLAEQQRAALDAEAARAAASAAPSYADRGYADRDYQSRGYDTLRYAPTRYSSSVSSGGSVSVRGYTRKDGTYVRPHTRSR